MLLVSDFILRSSLCSLPWLLVAPADRKNHQNIIVPQKGLEILVHVDDFLARKHPNIQVS
jgi:hypothetical protein